LPEPQRELVRRWVDAGAPRGDSAAVALSPARPASRRIVRSLDLVIPVETKVPAGTPGMGPGGSVELALKVGPLPAASALAFRGDGRQLAVGTYGEVVVWDVADARPALSIGG